MQRSPRQQPFVGQFPVDPNGQRAAVAAGYSPNAAKVTASRRLTDTNTRSLLQQRIGIGCDKALDVWRAETWGAVPHSAARTVR